MDESETPRQSPARNLEALLFEMIKGTSFSEQIRNNQLDILNELRSINEGLRWQQEYFKTQAEEVQVALSERQSEAQEWQKNPRFQEEVARKVEMQAHEIADTAYRIAQREIAEKIHRARSIAAKQAAATRKRNAHAAGR
jgi:hypothetical protein